MKKTLYSLKALALSAVFLGFAQLSSAQVGVGIATPDPSAQLHVESTDKGVLIPRVPSATAIATPAKALLVYQTNAPEGFYYNKGTNNAPNWMQLADAASNATPTFASAHNSTGSILSVILGGTRVPLPSSQVFSNVFIDPLGDQFTILEAGYYRIDYSVNITVALLMGVRVTQNDVPVSSTVSNPPLATSAFAGHTILQLNAGDVLSLELFGLLGIATLQSGNGASLTIQKL